MALTKRFVHDPTDLVFGSLRSLPLLNPTLRLDDDNKVIYVVDAADSPQSVAITSGGGSGHEPSFGAFVGHGLLRASVAGPLFASPSAQQILTAITKVSATTNKILVTVMNYTGDVLNFGVAVEKVKAQNPALEI